MAVARNSRYTPPKGSKSPARAAVERNQKMGLGAYNDGTSAYARGKAGQAQARSTSLELFDNANRANPVSTRTGRMPGTQGRIVPGLGTSSAASRPMRTAGGGGGGALVPTAGRSSGGGGGGGALVPTAGRSSGGGGGALVPHRGGVPAVRGNGRKPINIGEIGHTPHRKPTPVNIGPSKLGGRDTPIKMSPTRNKPKPKPIGKGTTVMDNVVEEAGGARSIFKGHGYGLAIGAGAAVIAGLAMNRRNDRR
jgi:hypothetical protein